MRLGEFVVKRNGTILGVLFVISLIIVGYGVLSETHRDVTSYVTFVAPILTVLVGQLVVSHQVKTVNDKTDDTAEKVKQVEKQTNGQLSAQFQDLKNHITNTVKATNDDSNAS